MTQPKIVFLMYHELELPGRSLVQSDPGYTRYVVPEPGFRQQLDWLKRNKWRGLCVTDALQFDPQPGVTITFDDGCETDLLAAAPLLQKYSFRATFYITSGFLGRSGYLSRAQLKELSDAGFEVGCHSRTHAYLTDLGRHDLSKEVAQSKSELEQVIGKPVEHFSCPGGRYNRQVAQAARESGYLTVATSRFSMNSLSTDPFNLGRVTILRTTSMKGFERICRGQGLWLPNAADYVRSGARNLLGNTLYDQLRGKLLRSD